MKKILCAEKHGTCFENLIFDRITLQRFVHADLLKAKAAFDLKRDIENYV